MTGSHNLTLAISTITDGTMLDRAQGFHTPELIANRQKFCQKHHITYADVVYQRITYADNQTYNKLIEVTEHNTTRYMPEVAADGLFTKQKNIGIMLPVADCVATCVYDPVREYLAVLHLGRHSTLTDLVAQSIAFFVKNGSDPTDLEVRTSPAAQRASYSVDYFDHADDPHWQPFYDEKDGRYYLDLPSFNRQAFIDAGVPAENIDISPIDTVTSSDYFSHSAGDVNGRFVMLAMME